MAIRMEVVMKTDTIAAVATGLNNAGISIVRISGKDAFPIIDRIFRSKNNNKSYLRKKSYYPLWLYL